MNPTTKPTHLPRSRGSFKAKRAFIKAATKAATFDASLWLIIAQVKKDPKALGFGTTADGPK